MLNITVSFFNISFDFVQTVCPICHQAFEFLIQKTMLAAVQTTEERLIASWYLMRISAHRAFSFIKCVL